MSAADRIRSISEKIEDQEIRGELNDIAWTVESKLSRMRFHLEKVLFAGIFKEQWTKRIVKEAQDELEETG